MADELGIPDGSWQDRWWDTARNLNDVRLPCLDCGSYPPGLYAGICGVCHRPACAACLRALHWSGLCLEARLMHEAGGPAEMPDGSIQFPPIPG